VLSVARFQRNAHTWHGNTKTMKILVAEYASAVGMGGTCEVEGRAMLSALSSSFERSGHEVVYPTMGPTIGAGRPILIKRPEEFKGVLRNTNAEAGQLIAPDDLQPEFLEILEEKATNLGCSPDAARLCADKQLCTKALKQASVPVAEVVPGPEPCESGCHRYVIKPRYGCGSEGVRISSFARVGQGEIATRYIEGMHLSASFLVGKRFLPLTINRQLIEFQDDRMSYCGSQVPYNTPRASEIWDAAMKASEVLGLRGYAGIDFVVGDLPRVVDVNARPTTSIIGILRVMREELGDLMVRARFGDLPEAVNVVGEHTFRKDEICQI
jgi:tyramine---L-glutamate ligase